MRICLSMIVKNESAVIERCLRSVKPFVHAWAVSDTGSSDGTQEIVRRVMDDMLETDAGFTWGALDAPGYLVEFVYGKTRFRRTALARLDAGWRWEGVLH